MTSTLRPAIWFAISQISFSDVIEGQAWTIW